MAEIDVSVQALRNVGMALKKFQRDTEPFSYDVRRQIAELRMGCELEMDTVRKQIEELLSEEKRLKYLIDSLNSEREKCKNQIPLTEMEISKLKNQIQSDQSGIEKARNRCFCDEEGNWYAAPDYDTIKKLENDVENCEREIELCNCEIEKTRREIERISAEIIVNENERNHVEKERKRKEDKLSKLRGTYFNISLEADNLVAAVNKFSKHAMEETDENISGIHRSIRYVEEYVTTNL